MACRTLIAFVLIAISTGARAEEAFKLRIERKVYVVDDEEAFAKIVAASSVKKIDQELNAKMLELAKTQGEERQTSKWEHAIQLDTPINVPKQDVVGIVKVGGKVTKRGEALFIDVTALTDIRRLEDGGRKTGFYGLMHEAVVNKEYSFMSDVNPAFLPDDDGLPKRQIHQVTFYVVCLTKEEP